jgi:hypothetical protein
VRALFLLCAAAVLQPASARESPEQFFDKKVAPILTRRCLGCHNEELKNGGISFLDRSSLLHGGSRGPAIVPGKPEESLLVRSLQHEGELQMPPGPKLPAREIRVLTDWIRKGAPGGSKLVR